LSETKNKMGGNRRRRQGRRDGTSREKPSFQGRLWEKFHKGGFKTKKVTKWRQSEKSIYFQRLRTPRNSGLERDEKIKRPRETRRSGASVGALSRV